MTFRMYRRVLITGDRNWSNCIRLFEVMDAANKELPIDLIIQGGARGADRMGRKWAEDRGVPWRQFDADWKLYGPAAGPIRNQQQLIWGRPEYFYAFHDHIEVSKGTKDMISRCLKKDLPGYLVTSTTMKRLK